MCSNARPTAGDAGHLPQVLRTHALARGGHQQASILVEGGAELSGSLLAGRFADELHCFIAPILLGPRGRPGAVDWAGPETPADAPRIVEPSWEVCGQDAYVYGPVSYPDKE